VSYLKLKTQPHLHDPSDHQKQVNQSLRIKTPGQKNHWFNKHPITRVLDCLNHQKGIGTGGRMGYALRDIHSRKYPLGIKLQIGSDPSNQIVLLDPQVAPFHAALWEQQNNLYLQDNSGGRGIFVNQTPIQGTVSLQMGDQVTIGGTLFTIDEFNPQVAIATPSAKKRRGCGRWLLICAGLFLFECCLVAAAGFLVASTDVEIRGGLQDIQELVMGSPLSNMANPPTGTDQPGPEILALTDIWLGSNYTSSFSQDIERTAEGVSPTGEQIKSNIIFELRQQVSPGWTSYNLMKQITNDVVIAQFEVGIVNGVAYSGTQTCRVAPDPEASVHMLDSTLNNLLINELRGHVKRVETGISINGVITDRYELRKDNFTMAESVIEFISGSLYRARDGGFLTRLEYVIKIKPQSWVINMSDAFSSTDPSLVTYLLDRTYVPDGTLPVKVPEVCANQVR
jgi:hypothetical protein